MKYKINDKVRVDIITKEQMGTYGEPLPSIWDKKIGIITDIEKSTNAYVVSLLHSPKTVTCFEFELTLLAPNWKKLIG